MARQPTKRSGDGSRKVRVDLRRNRAKRARTKDWSGLLREPEQGQSDPQASERVAAKGDLSRKRTIVVPEGAGTRSPMTQVPVLPRRRSGLTRVKNR